MDGLCQLAETIEPGPDHDDSEPGLDFGSDADIEEEDTPEELIGNEDEGLEADGEPETGCGCQAGERAPSSPLLVLFGLGVLSWIRRVRRPQKDGLISG